MGAERCVIRWQDLPQYDSPSLDPAGRAALALATSIVISAFSAGVLAAALRADWVGGLTLARWLGAIGAALLCGAGAAWSLIRTRNLHLLEARLPTTRRSIRAWVWPIIWVLIAMTIVIRIDVVEFDVRPGIFAIGFALAAWRPFSLIRRIFVSLSRRRIDELIVSLGAILIVTWLLLWWQLITLDGTIVDRSFTASGAATGVAAAGAVAFTVCVRLVYSLDRWADAAEEHRVLSLQTREEHRYVRRMGLNPFDAQVFRELAFAKLERARQTHDEVDPLEPVAELTRPGALTRIRHSARALVDAAPRTIDATASTAERLPGLRRRLPRALPTGAPLDETGSASAAAAITLGQVVQPEGSGTPHGATTKSAEQPDNRVRPGTSSEKERLPELPGMSRSLGSLGPQMRQTPETGQRRDAPDPEPEAAATRPQHDGIDTGGAVPHLGVHAEPVVPDNVTSARRDDIANAITIDAMAGHESALLDGDERLFDAELSDRGGVAKPPPNWISDFDLSPDAESERNTRPARLAALEVSRWMTLVSIIALAGALDWGVVVALDLREPIRGGIISDVDLARLNDVRFAAALALPVSLVFQTLWAWVAARWAKRARVAAPTRIGFGSLLAIAASAGAVSAAGILADVSAAVAAIAVVVASASAWYAVMAIAPITRAVGASETSVRVWSTGQVVVTLVFLLIGGLTDIRPDVPIEGVAFIGVALGLLAAVTAVVAGVVTLSIEDTLRSSKAVRHWIASNERGATEPVRMTDTDRSSPPHSKPGDRKAPAQERRHVRSSDTSDARETPRSTTSDTDARHDSSTVAERPDATAPDAPSHRHILRSGHPRPAPAEDERPANVQRLDDQRLDDGVDRRDHDGHTRSDGRPTAVDAEAGVSSDAIVGQHSTVDQNTDNIVPLVDINHADIVDLQSIPQIGIVMATRIFHDRRRRGPFTSLDDLQRVDGIGPARIELISPHISISKSSE